jgi:hypothetical protein
MASETRAPISTGESILRDRGMLVPQGEAALVAGDYAVADYAVADYAVGCRSGFTASVSTSPTASSPASSISGWS